MNKFLKDLLVAFFGVSAALFVNSLHESYNNRESYLAKGKAIVAEAMANDSILVLSFEANIRDSGITSTDTIIIYRDFMLTTVEHALTSDNFMSHVSDNVISTLTAYILVLKRLNSFRSAYQQYLEKGVPNKFLLYHVRRSMYARFKEAEKKIEAVQSIDL